MNALSILIVALLVISLPNALSFHVPQSPSSLPIHRQRQLLRITPKMHFEEAIEGNTHLSSAALPRERYVATNRFTVQQNKGPSLEKRWAERKSKIASLDGFRFFTLLRRVASLDGEKYEDDFGNYVSMTVWEKKEHFDAWRTSEAFKEVHGGGNSIMAFASLLSTALFILRGTPKPAFYDGLLPQIGSYNVPFTPGEDWRKVTSDGKTPLPPDVFVVYTKYNIPQRDLLEFEAKYKSTDYLYAGQDGYAGSFLMRRDFKRADDGYNYIGVSVWKDKAAYQAYRAAVKMPIIHCGRRMTVYFEGVLALNSAKGM